jgi:hypothetical protein
MQKRTFSRAEWWLLMAVLAWLIAVGLAGFTLGVSLPQFGALQQNGLQAHATVLRKLPYRSLCTTSSCTPYALSVGFNASARQTRVQIADLTVSQAEYERTKQGDVQKIIFLESKPDQIWLAEQVLSWSPWGNLAASGMLALLGGFFWFLSRRRS